MKKFVVRLTSCRKCNFEFLPFRFFKFQMTVVKKLMEKASFFIMDFKDSDEGLLTHKNFWSTSFWCIRKWILFVIFSNERNIRTSLLMMHLKCAVAHYANLNSSSINNSCLRGVVYAILLLFQFLILAFVKSSMKKLWFFNTNFQKFISTYSILQNIRMSNLNRRSFEYKVKF